MRIGTRVAALAGWMLAIALPVSTEDAAAPKGMEAEVLAVVGEVTAKRPGQNDFMPVKVGDRLPEKAEISTGLNAECRLKLPNTELKVEALTTTSIDRLRPGGVDEAGRVEAVDSKVSLKFGTVKFKVQKGALKTDLKIATPNSTTAISGTKGGASSYGDQPDLTGVTHGDVTLAGEDESYEVPGGEQMDPDGVTRLMRLRRWIFGRIYWVFGGTDGEREGGLNTGAGGAYNPPSDSLFGNGRSPFLESRLSFEGQSGQLPSAPPPPPPAP